MGDTPNVTIREGNKKQGSVEVWRVHSVTGVTGKEAVIRGIKRVNLTTSKK